ncbi:MAG TPA: flagellar hook-basal body complex protein FliE [Acetobacteraceae bacterium]|nr:flagellar hook-basal body complex protein FliE [Acetobacteraceae bacterium]
MTNALPGISAGGAIKAYQSVDSGQPLSQASGGGFSDLLSRALDGAVNAGESAEAQATKAISGHGDLTQVVTAVSQAQLALQTTVAIRDRVLQAYQDIIKMPI